MKKVYTNSWTLYKAAPYIAENEIAPHRRAQFNESIGKIEKTTKNLVSFLEDDAPFQPDKAPTLKALQKSKKAKVVIDKDTKEKNVKLRYIVCRQCSVEFPTATHNRLFCPDCAKSRKKTADSESSKKRYISGSRAKHSPAKSVRRANSVSPSSCLGKKIGNVKILDLIASAGNRSHYSCKCECGTIFVASHAALASLALQECPSCINKKAEIEIKLTNEQINDCSRDSETVIHANRFGNLEAKVKINNSLSLCNCGCGKRLVIPTDSLLNGSVKSCGCYDEARDLLPNDQPRSVFVGRKIGHTLVIAESRLYHCVKKPPNKLMNCRCDCGNEFLAKYGKLSNSMTRKIALSCGCSLKFQKEILKKMSKIKKIASRLGCYFLISAKINFFSMPDFDN